MNFHKVLIFMEITKLCVYIEREREWGGGGMGMGYIYMKQRNKQNMENCLNNVFQMCGYKNSSLELTTEIEWNRNRTISLHIQ